MKLSSRLLFVTLTLASCASEPPTDAGDTPVFGRITVVSGDSQIGSTGETLSAPIVVRVVNSQGMPLSGMGLTFDASSGGGGVSPSVAETDEAGNTEVFWTLGPGPVNTITVGSADDELIASPITITAANDRVLRIEAVSGDSQTARAGMTLPEPITLRLLNCHEEAVAGVQVRFDVVRGGGSVSESGATSDRDGMARVDWVVGAGPDNRLQIVVEDDVFTSMPAVVTAKTDLQFTFTWISGVPFVNPWGGGHDHDNRILETDHILTFSDAASDSAKTVFASLAEWSLAELLQDFEISPPSEIGLHPADQESKLTIYTMKDLQLIQMAFPYGFMLYGVDSDNYRLWFGNQPEYFENEVKHEMMHVLQFKLAGEAGRFYNFWFSEGIAEFVSGGAFRKIETWDQVVQWRSADGHINPTLILVARRDLPIPEERSGEYYSMFHLAVEYLLSERGHRRSLRDVKNMFGDIRAGASFETAFQAHMRISLEAFQASFYERIRAYLEG